MNNSYLDKILSEAGFYVSKIDSVEPIEDFIAIPSEYKTPDYHWVRNLPNWGTMASTVDKKAISHLIYNYHLMNGKRTHLGNYKFKRGHETFVNSIEYLVELPNAKYNIILISHGYHTLFNNLINSKTLLDINSCKLSLDILYSKDNTIIASYIPSSWINDIDLPYNRLPLSLGHFFLSSYSINLNIVPEEYRNNPMNKPFTVERLNYLLNPKTIHPLVNHFCNTILQNNMTEFLDVNFQEFNYIGCDFYMYNQMLPRLMNNFMNIHPTSDIMIELNGTLMRHLITNFIRYKTSNNGTNLLTCIYLLFTLSKRTPNKFVNEVGLDYIYNFTKSRHAIWPKYELDFQLFVRCFSSITPNNNILQGIFSFIDISDGVDLYNHLETNFKSLLKIMQYFMSVDKAGNNSSVTPYDFTDAAKEALHFLNGYHYMITDSNICKKLYKEISFKADFFPEVFKSTYHKNGVMYFDITSLYTTLVVTDEYYKSFKDNFLLNIIVFIMQHVGTFKCRQISVVSPVYNSDTYINKLSVKNEWNDHIGVTMTSASHAINIHRLIDTLSSNIGIKYIYNGTDFHMFSIREFLEKVSGLTLKEYMDDIKNELEMLGMYRIPQDIIDEYNASIKKIKSGST